MSKFVRRVKSVTGSSETSIWDWDVSHMKSALMYAGAHSKCAAKRVACLLVKGGGIISIGINGTPPGDTNCNELFRKNETGEWEERIFVEETFSNEFISNAVRKKPVGWVYSRDQRRHYHWSLLNEIHAEANAIGKCAKQGISTKGTTAYITHSPCHDCAKILAVSGIETIYYNQDFDNVEEVAKVLLNFGVRMYKLEV
jgi:dCMP deaminase